MAAHQYKLDNLCAVVDRNRLQISGNTEDVMGHDDLHERFRAFGWHVIDVADGNDIDQREQVDILGIYLNTLAQSYGPHSSYYPPQLNEDFDIQMSLSLTGIGATLTSEDGFIKIVSLVPGGPAAVDGRLKVEDRIIAVTQEDGETVDGVEDGQMSQDIQLLFFII